MSSLMRRRSQRFWRAGAALLSKCFNCCRRLQRHLQGESGEMSQDDLERRIKWLERQVCEQAAVLNQQAKLLGQFGDIMRGHQALFEQIAASGVMLQRGTQPTN